MSQLKQLERLAMSDLYGAMRENNLTVTAMCILMMAVGSKQVNRDDIVVKLHITDSNAGVYLHRLKDKGFLRGTLRGVYVPTTKCRKLIKSL